MKNEWLTSDWHLYHKNIMKFCKETRLGRDHIEMTGILIDNILSQAKPGDTIYNVGDMSYGSKAQTLDVLRKIRQMGVQHVLILGNHDNRLDQDHFDLFDGVYERYTRDFGGQIMVMDHFPLAEWNKMYHGSYHVHGHTHGSYKSEGRIMDVGIDCKPGMKMFHMDEVREHLDKQIIKKHH